MNLPDNIDTFLTYSWQEIEPFYRELENAALNTQTLESWLADWSTLSALVDEMTARLGVATTLNTEDQEIKTRYYDFLDNTRPHTKAAEQRIKQKFVESGLQPDGFDVATLRIRSDIDLFCEENLPLFAQEAKLGTQYDELVGSQTVEWEGEEKTPTQLNPLLAEPDRDLRERVWRTIAERRRQDDPAMNKIWQEMLSLRLQIAQNAGYESYRDYKWAEMHRFDYTPEDCFTFHAAIEAVVVPAASRIYERRKAGLQIDTLRPWDLIVDPLNRPPLRPFDNVERLIGVTARIFNRVDGELGAYFEDMRQANLLDLDNRKAKAPGGYCEAYMFTGKPFIMMNAVGLHNDVQTLLHEGGHSFHAYESARLVHYQQQVGIPMEFAEVASMAMELLAAPYLTQENGGFYSDIQAARARIEHLEGIITFWPYMAMVDAFQHWVYDNPDAAMNPENCDTKWVELVRRFQPDFDYSGLEEYESVGWRRKLHIFQVPFYYIEYGLAQLGAVQVWSNALKDQEQAVKDYRKALALGSTARLPELFATARAKFAFDADTLQVAVDLIEATLDELTRVAAG